MNPILSVLKKSFLLGLVGLSAVSSISWAVTPDQHLRANSGHVIVLDTVGENPRIRLGGAMGVAIGANVQEALFRAWHQKYPQSNPVQDIPKNLIDFLEYAFKTSQDVQILPAFKKWPHEEELDHLTLLIAPDPSPNKYAENPSWDIRREAPNLEQLLEVMENEDPVRVTDVAMRQVQHFADPNCHYRFLKDSLVFLRSKHKLQ